MEINWFNFQPFRKFDFGKQVWFVKSANSFSDNLALSGIIWPASWNRRNCHCLLVSNISSSSPLENKRMIEFKDLQHFCPLKLGFFVRLGSSWKLTENYERFKYLATLSIATTSLKRCCSNVTNSDNVWELCSTTLNGWKAANNCDILVLTNRALFCFSSSETNKHVKKIKN